MTAMMVDLFCKSFAEQPGAITLDIDDTAAAFQLPRHMFSAPKHGPNATLLSAGPMKQPAASTRACVLSIMDRAADALSP